MDRIMGFLFTSNGTLFQRNLTAEVKVFTFSKFIRYLINYLQTKNGLEKTEIPSPTFNIINEYEINSLIVRHFDLYRIKDKKELNNLGINENLEDYARLIEWPEILGKNIESTFTLKFEYDEKLENRYLIISNNIDFDFNEFEKI